MKEFVGLVRNYFFDFLLHGFRGDFGLDPLVLRSWGKEFRKMLERFAINIIIKAPFKLRNVSEAQKNFT